MTMAESKTLDPTAQYVMGLVFDEYAYRVLLIQKHRPARFAGLYNGHGGLIEKGETPLEAIIRETKEEIGLSITTWVKTVELTYDSSQSTMFVFGAQVSNSVFNSYTSPTDEIVHVIDIEDIWNNNIDIPYNLNWIIFITINRLKGEGPSLRATEES